LVMSGATNQEIERSQEEAANARARYLQEVEMQARKSAKAAGMTAQQSIEYIANSRSSASDELSKEERKLAQSNDVNPQQTERAKENNAAISAEEYKNLNSRTQDNNSQDGQTIKSQNDAATILANRKQVQQNNDAIGLGSLNLSTISKNMEMSQTDHNQIERPNTPDISAKPSGKSIA